MNHMQRCDYIDRELRRLTDVALVEVERMARHVMRHNPRCAKFSMAMGSFSFHDKRGEIVEAKYLDNIERFIGDYDRYLYLTGNPMQIEGADGELRTDW